MSNAFTAAFANLINAQVLLWFFQTPVAGAYAVTSVVLLGAVIYFESRTDKRYEAVQSQLKELNNRIDGLNLSKGFGR